MTLNPVDDYGSFSNSLLQEPGQTATQRVIDKWFEVEPIANRFSQSTVNAFQARDLQRLSAGQTVDGVNTTVRAMLAAEQQKLLTPPPKPNPLTHIHENFIKNARAMAASIPKIPFALFEEAKALPTTGETIVKNMKSGDSPIEAVAKAPGFRMVPGAYLAANAEHPGELLSNPLFTAFDALPYASKLAGMSKVAKLADAAEITDRPLNAVLTKKIVDVPGRGPTVVANRLGEGINRLGITPVGKFAKQVVGKESRNLARTVNYTQVEIAQAIDPHMPLPDFFDQAGIKDTANNTRAVMTLAKQHPRLVKDAQYAADFARKASLGQTGMMTADELAVMHDARQITEKFGVDNVVANELARHDGEYYPIKGFKEMQQRIANGEVADAPARYVPLIREVTKNILDGDPIIVVPRNVEQHINSLLQAKFGQFTSTATFNEIADAIAPSWYKMREAGIDPLFIHHVPTGKMTHLAMPKISEIPITPSQLKKRIWDATPGYQDVLVGMQHQGIELLQRAGSEHLVDLIREASGRTKQMLMDQYRPQVARELANMDPRVANEATAMERIINREWTPFNPEVHNFHWSSAAFNKLDADSWYIPRHIADNFKMWRNPHTTIGAKAVEPVMKMFRTSLLALSPRWHVNNTIGGGLALAVESPSSFRFLTKAIHMVRNPELLPEKLRFIMRTQHSLYDEMGYRTGLSKGRWFNESSVLGKAKSGLNTVVDKSYSANQFVDEVYRTMAYLQGESKAIRAAKRGGKILSAEESTKAGMELANKVLQNWADMTPWERSTLRFVFPFYGWIQHITRVALRYPADHPLRVAIMGSITRAELDDLGSGLPQKFLDTFFLGNPDPNGNQKAFVVGGLNPFRDAPDYFTLAGFMAATNPMIAVAMEKAGFKDGRTEAYPTLKYDPISGGMVAATPSLGGSLLRNTIPQAELLTMLTGVNKDYHRLMQTDPDAARRRMYALGGVPMPVRGFLGQAPINVPQEIGRHETTVHKAQTAAFNKALRTGDDSEANQFPALRVILHQLRQLQAQGRLDAFSPPPMQTLGRMNLAGGTGGV